MITRVRRLHAGTALRPAVLSLAMLVATFSGAAGVAGGAAAAAATTGGAHPVAVIDRQDLELSGVWNLGDLLSRRMPFNAFGLHRPFVLGSDRTAVLIDGRRVSDTHFDLSTIPVSAVARIEILKDSAAAHHGGHAIGGAVNIVLVRDGEGAEARVSVARPAEPGGDAEHASALWSGAVGRGHVTAGVDRFRREEIREADRDHSRPLYTPGGSFNDARGVSVRGNTVFLETTDSEAIVAPLNDCDERVYTGPLTYSGGEVCGFAYADSAWQWTSDERDTLFLAAGLPVGADTTLHLDTRVTRGTTRDQYAPYPGDFSFTPDDALKAWLIDEIDGLDDANFPPGGVTVAHRFIGHGNRVWETDREEHDVTLGVRGAFGEDVGYDARLRDYRYDSLEVGDTFIRESAIRSAIADGRYDVQNPLSDDPDHQAAIRESSLTSYDEYVVDHRSASFALDGPLPAPGGGGLGLRWRAGAEVADEDMRDTDAYRDRDGGLVDPDDVLGGVGDPVVGARRRWSAFGEVSASSGGAGKDAAWDVSLAGRRDDHDDVGETFSHRVAARYRVTLGVALRASWSEGGRPPSLWDLHAGETRTHPYVCDADTVTTDCERDQVDLRTRGNPDLEPDEARSFGVGAAGQWGPFALSADWFRIRLSDTPNQPAPQVIVTEERHGRLGAFPGAEVIRENGRITRIESPIVNTGETEIDGLDLAAGVDWRVAPVDIAVDLRWFHVTDSETRVAGVVQSGDFPRNRVSARLRASRGDIAVQWSTHAVSGYWDGDGTTRFEGWTGHAVSATWRDAFGFEGFAVTAGVHNVGDAGPSNDLSHPEAPLYYDSALGRTAFVTAKVAF